MFALRRKWTLQLKWHLITLMCLTKISRGLNITTTQLQSSWPSILWVMEKSQSAHQWCFLFSVPLLFYWGNSTVIVRAEADRETLDAADQHCRPHTDAHSDVCGSDFQPVCHSTQERLQSCPGMLWKIKIQARIVLYGKENHFSLLRFPRQLTMSSACACHQFDTHLSTSSLSKQAQVSQFNMCILFGNI